MKTKFIILFALYSFSLFAQDSLVVVDTPSQGPAPTNVSSSVVDDDDKDFNPRESHWIVTFGFEGTAYKSEFEFEGARKVIRPDKKDMYGGRLGIGGELYLGAGFSTSTKIEGYYAGTVFARTVTAGVEVADVDFATTKRTGQLYGGDLVQTLSFVFDMKTKNPFMDEMSYLTVEPFVEAGVGYAQAFNKINYNYDTLVLTGARAGDGVREGYRVHQKEGLTNQRVGGGINLISTSGYYFYAKTMLNRFDSPRRILRGVQRVDGSNEFTQINQKIDNPKIKPVTSFSIGGGYKF